MAKYNWNIDTLIEKKNLIEKLILLEKDQDKLELLKKDYYNLQNIIDDENDYSIYDKMSLLENFDYIKENLQTIEFLWEDFKEFNNTINEPIITPELKRSSLSKNDLLTITHDFYKSLNRYFYGNFMKNFYRRNDHIYFNSYNNEGISGETIGLPSLKEAFIKICRDYTNEDILTVIHEYSHATSLSINPNNLNDTKKSLYTEIDTIFMELVASDYISKLFKDNSNTIFKASKLNEFADNADELSIMIDIIEGEKYTENGYTSNKMLKNIASKHFNVIPEVINDVIGEPNLTNTIYLTSYMFSLELYKQYLQDKEKALYNLKKIILLDNMNELEYYSNIKRLGLFPNLSLKTHYNEVKNEAKKLTRKK